MRSLFTKTAITIATLLPSYAFAQSPGSIPQFYLEGNIGNVANVSDWVNLLITGVRWFYTILFIVALLYILLASFNFITSGGDQEKVKTARRQLIFAIVGIAVALVSYTVISLVRNTLSGA